MRNLINKFYDIIWFFQKLFYDIKKMYDWYMNVFRNDYDFDGHGIFALMHYKLLRTQRAMLNGYVEHEHKDLKALRISIKLLKRLSEDQYDDRGHRKHDKKWGELKTWTTKVEGTEKKPGGPYYRMHFARPKANTEEEKNLENQEHIQLYTIANNIKKRDFKWVNNILLNYLERFGD